MVDRDDARRNMGAEEGTQKPVSNSNAAAVNSFQASNATENSPVAATMVNSDSILDLEVR